MKKNTPNQQHPTVILNLPKELKNIIITCPEKKQICWDARCLEKSSSAYVIELNKSKNFFSARPGLLVKEQPNPELTFEELVALFTRAPQLSIQEKENKKVLLTTTSIKEETLLGLCMGICINHRVADSSFLYY